MAKMISKRNGASSFLPANFFKKLKQAFHTKNIVVVSQHSVGHYAFSIKQQLAIVFAVIAVVGASSFSIGRYIQAKEKIKLQRETINVVQNESKKMNNDFALLKRDLMKMSEDGTSMSDYSQFVLEQYQTEQNFAGTGASNKSKMLERINFLEHKLQQSEMQRAEFINDVYLLTKDKVRALHKALKPTGIEGKISRAINVKMQKIAEIEAGGGQGGIYQPINDEQDLELNQQLAVNEVVYLAKLVEMIDALPINRPIEKARRTSGFGRRLDPFKRTLANHTGVDFSAPAGAKVLASAAGRVRSAVYSGAYGKCVDIDHGHGITSRYGHLKTINVAAGQRVNAGEVIGVQGSTGRSTGNHLHYEIRHNNVAINPDRFLKVGGDVSKILQ